jgi:hypothetical protein
MILAENNPTKNTASEHLADKRRYGPYLNGITGQETLWQQGVALLHQSAKDFRWAWKTLRMAIWIFRILLEIQTIDPIRHFFFHRVLLVFRRK